MSDNNTLVRALHDVGGAAWFGGTLMGAVGLNGAAGDAKDPTERLRLSAIGWARWTPVQIVAIGAHAVGGIGLMVANRGRLAHQGGAQANTAVKLAVTGLAAGLSGYAGVLGAKIAQHSQEGAEGSVTPDEHSSAELASAQRQLKVIQTALPVLTGLIVVLGAQQGEQQRTPVGLADKVRSRIG